MIDTADFSLSGDGGQLIHGAASAAANIENDVSLSNRDFR